MDGVLSGFDAIEGQDPGELPFDLNQSWKENPETGENIPVPNQTRESLATAEEIERIL